MRARFPIYTVLLFTALFTARAADTNQITAPLPAPGVTNNAAAETKLPPATLTVLRTFDTQIADINTEIQQAEDRRAVVEKNEAQRLSLGLPPDPADDINMGRLNDSTTFLTNQLQMWQEKRALYLKKQGQPLMGPRPAPPKP